MMCPGAPIADGTLPESKSDDRSLLHTYQDWKVGSRQNVYQSTRILRSLDTMPSML